jgi:hypothetical protein
MLFRTSSASGRISLGNALVYIFFQLLGAFAAPFFGIWLMEIGAVAPEPVVPFTLTQAFFCEMCMTVYIYILSSSAAEFTLVPGIPRFKLISYYNCRFFWPGLLL